jgi:hypothetical protein
MHGRDEKLYKILVGKPVGKRPLGRPRCRKKYIRMGLREKIWDFLSRYMIISLEGLCSMQLVS